MTAVRRTVETATPIDIEDRLSLIVTAYFENGKQHDATEGAEWVSSSTEVATVDDSGVVVPTEVGSVDINAVVDGVSSSTVTLTVTHDAMVSISITPPNDLSPSTIRLFEETQLTVMAHFANGDTSDVTGRALFIGDNDDVIWRSGDFFGVALGPTVVSASLERDGQTLTADLEVEVVVPAFAQ